MHACKKREIAFCWSQRRMHLGILHRSVHSKLGHTTSIDASILIGIFELSQCWLNCGKYVCDDAKTPLLAVARIAARSIPRGSFQCVLFGRRGSKFHRRLHVLSLKT